MEVLVDRVTFAPITDLVSAHVLSVLFPDWVLRFPVRREPVPAEVTRNLLLVRFGLDVWTGLFSPMPVDSVFIADALVVSLGESLTHAGRT